MVNLSSHLGAWDEIVVWLNALLALTACAANVRAAARRRAVRTRALHAATAALAAAYLAAYLAAYIALEAGDIDPAAWSSLMRGVSLVAWVTVWVLPAINHAADDALVERFVESVRKEWNRPRSAA